MVEDSWGQVKGFGIKRDEDGQEGFTNLKGKRSNPKTPGILSSFIKTPT